MARIAVLVSGTRGDVQPYAALAFALTQRGHAVTITADEDTALLARASGARCVTFAGASMRAIFESDEGRRLLARGSLWRLLRLLEAKQVEHVATLVDGAREAVTGAELVVAHPLFEAAAHGLCRHLDVPYVRTQLVPVVPTRAFASPFLGGAGAMLGKRRSHALALQLRWRAERRAFFLGAKRLGVSPSKTNPHILAERESVPCALIVSPTLLQRPNDWPSHHVQTGHCFLPPAAREALAETPLDAWLAQGDAPIYFGFGSMPVLDPPATLELIARVARGLGRRAVVGAGWTSFAQLPVPADVCVAPALALDAVLPQCAAAVHHGGLGTCTDVLAAGLGSVVCDFLVDQAFWGGQLVRLGVAERLPFRRLNEPALTAALRRVLADPVRARARALRSRMAAEDGLNATVAWIERVLSGASVR